MNFLKQSTASQTRSIGAFVDDTDFKTVENGLTIANTDIKLKKNGATAVNKNSGGATSDVNGMYAVTFDATDTNTVGELEVSVGVAGALVVWKTFFVLEEAVYDALFGSTAPGYLQPTVAGRTLDVSTGGESGVDWANVGGQSTSVDLSATAINLVDTCTVNTDMVGTNSALLASSYTAPDNAGISSNGSAIAALNDVAATDIVTAGAIGTLAGAIINVDLVDLCTANSDMVGTNGALLAANINLTAGAVDTVTSVTNDVGVNSLANDTITALSIASGALNGKGNWNIGKTGYTLTQAFPSNFSSFAITAGGLVDITQAAADKMWSTTVRALTDKANFTISGTITTLDGLENVSTAEVNAEVVDVLTVDTFTLPGQVAPPLAPTFEDAIMWNYKALRNRTSQTSTLWQLMADNETTVDAKATISDDGSTAIKQEIVSGP